MKVAHIITGLGAGGAQEALLKLVGSADDGRIDHTIVSLIDEGLHGTRLRTLGVPLHALGMRPGVPSPIKFLTLVRLLQRLQPDVVQTWMYHADLFGGLAARAARTPALLWSIRHGNLDPAANKASTLRVAKICARLSSRMPDRILSVSHAAARTHAAVGYDAMKLVVIPNGIDCERFAPDAESRARLRAEWGIGETTPLVGLFSRWDPQKDHANFAAAAEELARARPDVRFALAGEGIDAGNSALCTALTGAGLTIGGPGVHLARQVLLLGRRDDMPALCSAIDVLASSSCGEGFPNVVAEAMSSETPCVVTDVGDSAEIVGRYGAVVAPRDAAALARALAHMLALPAKDFAAIGRAARQSIRERFSIDSVRERYIALYREILAQQR
ncbi:MAG: glycosyltransferase [Burkholderiaceae bacterium]|nr:glycosyltransferase [Burkholderiaceae bacterium]MEB2317250.1 glycosyltransferase [Pseudomonadota bacterium]